MFEHGGSRGASQVSRCMVAVTHGNGRVENYSVRLPMSGKIADAMNGSDTFLDVMTPDGEQRFIAKHDVKCVTLVDVPKVNQLNHYRRSSDKAPFDPYQQLKVARGASPDEIKQAYHRLVRLYHPDRLANVELPGEVQDYVRAMLVRINLAYEQIGG